MSRRGATNRTLIFALIAVSACLLAAVGKLRQVREQASALGAAAWRPKVGAVVAPAELHDEAGHSVTIAAEGADGFDLLFVLSRTCVHCERTAPYWKHIEGQLLQEFPSQLRILRVDVGPPVLPGQAVRGALGSDEGVRSYRFQSSRSRSVLMLEAVPVTLLVAPGGRVAAARVGAIQSFATADSVVREVRSAIAVGKERR